MLYYYEGEFNPWTRQHQKILESFFDDIERNKSWGKDDRFLICVKQMKDCPGAKGHALCSSEEYRIEIMEPCLLKLAKKYQFLKYEKNLVIDIQTKNSAQEYFNNRKTDLSKGVTFIMSPLEYQTLLESNPDEAKQTELVKFFVYNADNPENTSSAVLDILHRNPYASYDELKVYLFKKSYEMIKVNHLYWQFGYEDEYRMGETSDLNKYDMTKYPRPSATVDIIVVNEKGKTAEWEILLIRRKGNPFKGFWALPGGFLDIYADDTLEEAASRELEEETGILFTLKREDQFRTYSDKWTDPRGRIVDTVYAITGKNWFPKAGDDASEVCWFNINELPRMAFNHRKIIEDYVLAVHNFG